MHTVTGISWAQDSGPNTASYLYEELLGPFKAKKAWIDTKGVPIMVSATTPGLLRTVVFS